MEVAMERTRSDARWLYWGGALLCGLATVFLWGQLAIDVEYLLVLAALVATALGIAERPRAHPDWGMLSLGGIAALSGSWFAGGAYLGLVESAAFHPLPLLLALGLSLVGALAVVAVTWQRADEKRAARLMYALVGIATLASGALYYQLFTVGIAEHQVARRMILTLAWLAGGLTLIVRSGGRTALRNPGRLLLGAAFLKALAYDTTHLEGSLRIVALLVTGGLLFGGAWAVRRQEAA
jgi:hypothetical protein